MRLIFISAVIISFPMLAIAQEAVREGHYRLQTDGGEGTLTIEKGRADLTVVRQGFCVGGVDGNLSPVENGITHFTTIQDELSCTVTVNVDAEGRPVYLTPGYGCTSFHGFGCSFNARVTGLDVPISIEAIDTAFNARSTEERRAIQIALRDLGKYNGAIDGITGVGTRRGIISAARDIVSTDSGVSLANIEGAKQFMLNLINTEVSESSASSSPTRESVVQSSSDQTFLGRWSCNLLGMDMKNNFEFEDGVLKVGMFDMQMSYDLVEPIGSRPNAWSMELADGTVLGLFDITRNSMIMMGNSEIFDCKKN